MNLPFYIGLRYTGAKRKSRSVSFLSGVSIIGLTVGISLLILVLSVMNGFDRELKNRILGLVPQAAVYHREQIDNWPQLKAELEGFDGVEAASPFVQLHGLVSYQNKTASVMLYGFDPLAEKGVSLIDEFIPSAVLQRISAHEPVILLGKNVAENLGVAEGDSVMLVVPGEGASARSAKIEYFELAKIIESKTELDASLALTSLSRASHLAGLDEGVSGMRLRVTDLFDAPRLMYDINRELGSQYSTSNWTRTHWNLYQAIQMSKNLVALLMSLIVAIAAFNVVSTLVLVVIDKQGDIAILRTLGASSRQILLIFMFQGVAIGLLGTLFGIVAGCLLALGIENFVAFIEVLFGVQFLQSDTYPLTYLPTEIRLNDLFTVSFTALAMSLIATLYPAWKATKIRPAVALRYE